MNSNGASLLERVKNAPESGESIRGRIIGMWLWWRYWAFALGLILSWLVAVQLETPTYAWMVGAISASIANGWFDE